MEVVEGPDWEHAPFPPGRLPNHPLVSIQLLAFLRNLSRTNGPIYIVQFRVAPVGMGDHLASSELPGQLALMSIAR